MRGSALCFTLVGGSRSASFICAGLCALGFRGCRCSFVDFFLSGPLPLSVVEFVHGADLGTLGCRGGCDRIDRLCCIGAIAIFTGRSFSRLVCSSIGRDVGVGRSIWMLLPVIPDFRCSWWRWRTPVLATPAVLQWPRIHCCWLH
jgi:hypothetical protein